MSNPIPRAELNDRHGTRCAGLIAGKSNNGICGVGVAYNAGISAIRILSKNLSASSEAAAVTYRYDENHIYSCSWGPADDGKSLDGPPKKVLKAFADGVMNGRKGLGSIYVFAAGNGKSFDNCNFDGYANGIFSTTIGAIDSNNAMPVYMEPCSAQLAVTYSSGYDKKIVTTDLGNDSCTMKHGGTSAATPIAAGVFALVLSARPDLTWRDLQNILVESAQPISTLDPSWHLNGAGYGYSPRFGFGKIDAEKIVTMAESWKKIGPPMLIAFPFHRTNLYIPVGFLHGISDTISIDANLESSVYRVNCLRRLEHVTVTVDIDAPIRGELQIFLRSPSGMVSQLATRRPLDKSAAGLKGWTFMSVAFWGEQPFGSWTLNVVDKRLEGEPGKLVEWRLSLWGESSCEFSKDDYMQAFVRNYYPPSPDYFVDTLGIWEEKMLIAGNDRSCYRGIFGLAMLIILTWLTYNLAKVIMRKLRYRPLSSNTQTSL